ncbi:MAG: branched-chain amino acid ABC transporter permease [Burkholderiales bacterium]
MSWWSQIDWASVLIQGTLIGGLYALFAIGLSLAFGIMRLVNIAHGDLIVLCAYVAMIVVNASGMHPLLSIAIVVPIMFIVGYLMQRGLLNFTLGPSILPPLLVTFGISVIIQNVLLEVFGADTRRLNAGAMETASIAFPGDVTVGVFPLVIFAVALVSLGGLQFLLYRTKLGRAFRATSDDAGTAELMGINNRHLYSLAMGIALAFTALAAVLFSIRTSFDPAAGPINLIFAFEAVIIGGLGSLWGTLIGGIILGVSQSLGGSVVGPFVSELIGNQVAAQWQILTGHIVFIIVLIVKPDGLFPRIKD